MKVDINKVKTIGRALGSVALLAYLALALTAANSPAADPLCSGVTISVAPGPSGTGFVDAADIAAELDGLPSRLVGRPLSRVNTESLRRRLSGIDKIERVDVFSSTNGRININVFPLDPVARVFDGRESYYLNREGKRMATDARYHMDVPVVSGRFGAYAPGPKPAELLPLLEELGANPVWSKLLAMIEVDSRGDILLVPAISGHVVNLGDAASLASKLNRVERMYRNVLPVKGWDYYDTISVKWAGQVVATRRHKAGGDGLAVVDDPDDDAADLSSMLAEEGAAPGQARTGVPAHNEKPIPGAHAAPANPKDNSPLPPPQP